MANDAGTAPPNETEAEAKKRVRLGIALGIASFRSERYGRLQRPFLDAAQTMPAFVYLLPRSRSSGRPASPRSSPR